MSLVLRDTLAKRCNARGSARGSIGDWPILGCALLIVLSSFVATSAESDIATGPEIDENGEPVSDFPMASTFGAFVAAPPEAVVASAQAIPIGVDAVHAIRSSTTLATGADFEEFRATIAALGLAIVPLNSFTPADLQGLAAVILMQPYAQNGPGFSAEEMDAVLSFVAAGGVSWSPPTGEAEATGGSPTSTTSWLRSESSLVA